MQSPESKRQEADSIGQTLLPRQFRSLGGAAILCLGIGILTWALFRPDFFAYFRRGEMIAVQANVVAPSLEYWPWTTSGRGWRLRVEYRYSMGRTEYVGSRFTATALDQQFYPHDRALVEFKNYPRGTPITVFVDPNHPGLAVRSRSDSPVLALLVWLQLGLIGVGSVSAVLWAVRAATMWLSSGRSRSGT